MLAVCSKIPSASCCCGSPLLDSFFVTRVSIYNQPRQHGKYRGSFHAHASCHSCVSRRSTINSSSATRQHTHQAYAQSTREYVCEIPPMGIVSERQNVRTGAGSTHNRKLILASVDIPPSSSTTARVLLGGVDGSRLTHGPIKSQCDAAKETRMG